MIDLWNFIISVIVAFILGLATHSIFLHEKARQGWKFPWDHKEKIENESKST